MLNYRKPLLAMSVLMPALLVIDSLSHPAEWLTLVLIVCIALLIPATGYLLWLMAQDPRSPTQRAAAAESNRLD